MLVKLIKDVNRAIAQKSGKVGLVPTMGYLHEGHLSLIKEAKKENDIVIVSIFVNPTQFAANEDLESYPRDIERDYKLAMEAGADIVFNPEVSEIYVENASTTVEVEGDIVKKLCGKFRPTHFKGVTSIVNILFNIVQPDNAYFGQKDAQQAMVIQKMVRDLHMKVNLRICPIIREEDGLAMSSRNIYLNQEERKQALILNQALMSAKEQFESGQYDANVLKAQIQKQIETMPLANIDYVEILDGKTLEDIEIIKDVALAAVAVKFGTTRLIDNQILKMEE